MKRFFGPDLRIPKTSMRCGAVCRAETYSRWAPPALSFCSEVMGAARPCAFADLEPMASTTERNC